MGKTNYIFNVYLYILPNIYHILSATKVYLSLFLDHDLLEIRLEVHILRDICL